MDPFARVLGIVTDAGWPGVEAATSYGTPSLKVRGKFMARLKDADTLVVRCPLGEKELLLEAEPSLFFETGHYRGYDAVLMRLERADDLTLRGRLERAWRMQASPRVVAAYDRDNACQGTDPRSTLTATITEESMSKARGKFCWYELMTSDVAASKAFYTSVAGWTTAAMGHYTIVEADGRGIGGIMQWPDDQSAAGGSHWIGYVAVEDVDAFVEEVKGAGGALHRAAENIPDVGRFAVVADPQGADFVLFKPSGEAPPPAAPAPVPGRIGWHELHATDGEAAFAFYEKLFGWTKADAIDMGPMGTYQLFAIDGVPVGGMMNRTPEMPTPTWLYYINVEDIEAGVARVKNAGGQVINGPHEVPGGSWIAMGLDTTHALFAIVKPVPM